MFQTPVVTTAFNVTVPLIDVTWNDIPIVLAPKSVVDVSVYDADVEFHTQRIVPALIAVVPELNTTYSKYPLCPVADGNVNTAVVPTPTVCVAESTYVLPYTVNV